MRKLFDFKYSQLLRIEEQMGANAPFAWCQPIS
jgi:hypothetical protein